MRFTGEQQVSAPVAQVWTALHDSEVLRRVIPGCEQLVPVGSGRYAATLAARVGPVADTYRGQFTVEPLVPGSSLRVGVEGRGRFGHLSLGLDVLLREGRSWGTTALAYEADAVVGGLVARVGNATMGVVGGHLTSCFFRDLDRAVRQAARRTSRISEPA
jgi:carbon monoxide dehydrogenase subunit G